MSELLFFIIETMLGGCIGVVTLCLITYFKASNMKNKTFLFLISLNQLSRFSFSMRFF